MIKLNEIPIAKDFYALMPADEVMTQIYGSDEFKEFLTVFNKLIKIYKEKKEKTL